MQKRASPESTIEQVETAIAEALKEASSALPASVREFIVPPGFDIVVELQEDGRKKRRTASSENWNPELGEIVIFFEKRHAAEAAQPLPASQESTWANAPAEKNYVSELVQILLETEETRDWVALKWFRDEVLPARAGEWASSAAFRQDVLKEAIDEGRVITSRIHNPHAPQFPTTTVRVNRGRLVAHPSAARFRPVTVRGEAVSATLLRDRGD